MAPEPDDDMRGEIVRICVDALREQGVPGVSETSVLADPCHAAAAVRLLEDCRPLPVVLALIDELRSVRAT
ncbi:MAG: hypothetical protein JNL71_16695 [Rhodospirillales bacterium]|nr:hypothetical protein [Rhodospirillales bacterium]